MRRRRLLIRFVGGLILGWALLAPALVNSSYRLIAATQTALDPPSGERRVVPLAGSQTVGFTFTAPEDGLAGLELGVVTFDRVNKVKVRALLYHLQEGEELAPDPAGRTPIRRAAIDAAGAEDWGLATFRFPPINDSAHERYYALFVSPEGRMDRCLGALVTDTPPSDGRLGYRDSQPSPDLPVARLLMAGPQRPWYLTWWWLILAVPAASATWVWFWDEG